MKKLAIVVLALVAAGTYAQKNDLFGPSGAADGLPQGVEATADAEQTFVRIKGLKEASLQLQEAGLPTLAESVDGYRERAQEHLERGEVDRALGLANQGYQLAEQGLGEPLPEATARAAAEPTSPSSDAPRPAGAGGGSIMTEQMAVVDMFGTVQSGDTQPVIRGARSKAHDAAANAAASNRRVEDELLD